MRHHWAVNALAAILVAVAVGYGWYAWDTGLIPGNPRAPTAKNFELAILAASRENFEAPLCHPLSLRGIRAEEDYSGGARSIPGKGVFGVTIVQDVGGEERVRGLAMLRLLASVGFMSETETTFEDESGRLRPAKHFRLTQSGWFAMGPNQCLHIGYRSFSRILKTLKLDSSDGTTAYEIVYEARVRDLPKWATVAGAESVFGQLKMLTTPIERRVKLIRTPDGWDVRFTRSTLRGVEEIPGEEPVFADSSEAPRTPALPSTAEAARLLSNGRYGPRLTVACLLLPADFKSADEIGDARNDSPEKPYFATYYDDPAKSAEALMPRADSLGLMRALQSIGMIEEDLVSDTAMNRQRYFGGAVFRMKQKYKAQIDPGGPGLITPGCLPIGTLTPQVNAIRWVSLSAHPSGSFIFHAQMLGVAKIRDVSSWVTETGADKAIPLVKTIVEEGLPLSGSLMHTAKDGWTQSGAEVARPVYAATARPSALFAALPRFASSESPKAPVNGEAHVIVVYEGNKSAVVNSPGQHKEGLVIVVIGKTPLPVELFLSSYDPVIWRLSVEPGANLARIVAVGYHPQRVIGAPPGVTVESNHPPQKQSSPPWIRFQGGATEPIIKAVHELTKSEIKSVRSTYTGSYFTVGQTAAGPIPVAPPRRKETAILRCGGDVIVCGEGRDTVICNGRRITCE